MTPSRRDALLREFGARQLDAYGSQAGCVGVFFWTWNAPEHESMWSFQRAVANGWLAPARVSRLGARLRERAAPVGRGAGSE